MIVCSLLGAVLGGTLVVVCLALSLLGGILAMFGKSRPTARENANA